MTALMERVVVLAQPWAELYAGSTRVSAAVEFLHLGGLLMSGGLALAFDRTTLRVAAGIVSDRSAYLRELNAVHLPVMAGLVVVIASGLALMLADVELYMASSTFWLKMSVFGLLLVNGIAIRAAGWRLRRDAMDARGWDRLRWGSLRSIALWSAVLFLGVLLTVAAQAVR